MSKFSEGRVRPNVWVIIATILLHLAILYAFIRALAPETVASVEGEVMAVFDVSDSVTEATPPPDPEPQADEGAQGEPGREAVPRPVTAPQPKQVLREDRPAPRASSTGEASTTGATASGEGTGAGGSGFGTGAGGSGSGQGSVAVSKPQLLQDIRDIRAFPIPPGGRQARIGESVIVRLQVSAQGRATSCSIYQPSPFPETDATVCRLAIEQTRFEPARDANGVPVAASFYYRQRFFN
ncbi:TonB family protein [Erythrobacter litoralis]|uniref:TonB family protein n=1 Tax=Erythrobacter litoralis TaxID=39960 RepID=UPI0024348004|nr:TonB family protein [Erythrobacter litoralis]MDG6077960.1 TonB family protein [Erythrobacter litoralis]